MAALIETMAALATAEKSAEEYARAVAGGTEKLEAAKAAEIEAARIVAETANVRAKAAFQARADGSAAAAANAKAKELAIAASGGEEAVEKYKKAGEAMRIARDSSLSLGQRLVAGASAARFAAGAVGALASTIVGISQDFDKAVASTYQYDQRLAALSRSLDAMRVATAGVVDTQVAFNLEFALADRGIRASAEQMAVLARATREYARERQTTQQEASQAVTAALDGDAQAAARFGLRLDGATTASQRHALALQQLAQLQQRSAVSSADAAEQARVRQQAEEHAADRLKSFGNVLLDLFTPVGAYRETVSLISQIETAVARTSGTSAEAAQQAREHETAIRRTIAAREAQKRLDAATSADQRRDRAIEQGAANAELQRHGLRIAALGQVVTAQQQYTRALFDANHAARRAGETTEQFETRRLTITRALSSAQQRLNAEASRQDSLRRSEAEVGLLARQLRAHGMVVDARIRSISPTERLLQLQRELAGFAAREGESVEETRARFTALGQEIEQQRSAALEAARSADERRRALRDLREEHARAVAMGGRVIQVERIVGETATQWMQRRAEAQREANDLLVEMEAEASARRDAIDQERRDGERQEREEQRRRDAELRTATEQRIFDKAREAAVEQRLNAERLAQVNSLEVQMREAFGMAEEHAQTATQKIAESAKSGLDGIGELGKGAVEALVQASLKGENAGAALAGYIDQWATQKAVQWGMQSLESFAGAGLAYLIRPDAVPGLLASGATYAGLALAAGGVAAAIPNAPAASSPSSTSSGSGGGLGLAASSRADVATAGAAPNIVFNISGVMANEQTQETLVRALRDAHDRGLTMRGL